VFSAHTGRRIVVATNVAETSLTVPGIRYVVDAGMARISRYSRRTKVQQLPIEAISQASARQRAGRCGRLGPGICIRLYAEDDLAGRPEYTDPEILRTNLASVMLQMAAIGLGAVEDFPFIDPPDTRSIKDGIALLEELGAVRPGAVGSRRWLTPIGRKLARIPVDPRLGRILLAAGEEGCLREGLTIVSALAIPDPRERPLGKEQAADQRHARFKDERSDFMSWLRLWEFVSASRRELTSSRFRRMCRDEFLSWRRVREWQDVRAQLRRVTEEMGLRTNRSPAAPETVHHALLAGLLSHVGRKDPASYEYRGARGARFAIRPGSALFKRAPEWIMAAELVETTRTWATGVAAVEPATIEEVGAHLVRRSVSDPWWDQERGSAVARETVTLNGMPLVSDRILLYDRFDPKAARELFIRHALVAGEWETHHEFAIRNAAAIDAVLEVEDRERRTDLLVADDAMAHFFDGRIPDDITSTRHFDRWWKTEREHRADLLDLSPDDLIDPGVRAIDEVAYPREWQYGDLNLPLTYTFDPSSAADGVAIEIPLAVLDRIDPDVFEWNVPGFRLDLVTALIRSLPKALRKRLTPVAVTARSVIGGLQPERGRLRPALAADLSHRAGLHIQPEDFDLNRVPAHVLPHYRIVGPDDVVVATGDDLRLLVAELKEAARETLADSAHPIERDGITEWTFGALPPSIDIGGTEQPLTAYPALIDMGDSVSIRLLATATDQANETWQGLRRLVILQLPSPRRLLRAVLDTRHVGPIAPYASVDEWMQDCLECAVDSLLATAEPVFDRTAFDALVHKVRGEIADELEVTGRIAVEIRDSLRTALAVIDSLPAAVFGDVIDDVERQMDRFVFPGMLTAVGAHRLADVRRYLEAITYRVQRLPENPDRDRLRMAVVTALEAQHDELAATLPLSPELVDVAWMLQELRVSLFAQSLGVNGPVSEKRIAAALADLPR
jgi:ATP-dependent helicase HrpA